MADFNFKKNNFDLIRLLAAMQVAFVHGCYHFDLLEGSLLIEVLELFPGVPIFFVVSGFLISASLERTASYGLRSYFKNRFLRIYPALWVCFAVSLLSVFLVYHPEFSLSEFFVWVAAQLSVGQFYNPDFMRGYGVGVLNGSLWTIPVELQFYLVLPLIYLVLDKVRWQRGIVLIAFVSLVAVNQLYVSMLDERSIWVKLFGVTVLPYLYMFMFGVFLQRRLDLVEKLLHGNFLLIFMLYLGVCYITHSMGLRAGGNYLNPLSAMMLSALAISFAYYRVDVFGNVLRGNDISYGVYIYHMVVVNALVQMNAFPAAVNQGIMLPVTIALALISWRLVEKPALGLKNVSIMSRKSTTPI